MSKKISNTFYRNLIESSSLLSLNKQKTIINENILCRFCLKPTKNHFYVKNTFICDVCNYKFMIKFDTDTSKIEKEDIINNIISEEITLELTSEEKIIIDLKLNLLYNKQEAYIIIDSINDQKTMHFQFDEKYKTATYDVIINAILQQLKILNNSLLFL